MIDPPSPPTNWDLIDDYLRCLSNESIKSGIDHYWDRWTWDTGTDEDKKLAELLEEELKMRNGPPTSHRARPMSFPSRMSEKTTN